MLPIYRRAEMQITVIIAAGGSGQRMGKKSPKAFLPLNGDPLFLHSVRTFASVGAVGEIILVCPEKSISRLEKRFGKVLCRLKVTKIVPGGAKRQDSVKKGLSFASADSDIILVHDAARPFVSATLIRKVAKEAQKHGAAVPALPVRDTIKIVNSARKVIETPPRENTWAAQTPQGIQSPLFRKAYRKLGRKEATDDVEIVERAGGKVVVVEGEPENFKITDPDDMVRAAQIAKKRAKKSSRRKNKI